MKNINEHCALIETEKEWPDFFPTKSEGIEIWCTICGKDGEHVRPWVAVKDALPNEGEEVLTYGQERFAILVFENCIFRDIQSNDLTQHVTYWQRLAMPYNKEA